MCMKVTEKWLTDAYMNIISVGPLQLYSILQHCPMAYRIQGANGHDCCAVYIYDRYTVLCAGQQTPASTVGDARIPDLCDKYAAKGRRLDRPNTPYAIQQKRARALFRDFVVQVLDGGGEGDSRMTINKEYVLYQRRDKGAEQDRYIYDYCTVDAGTSDIAALTYRTGNGEVGTIPFGTDGDYRARLIAGDTEVPQHYQEGKILDTAAPWMWLYDDEGKVCDLVNQYGFEVYSSGVMGLLIRFKLKGG